MYRVLGVEYVRHRRPAAPEVVLRRLLSLDYLLERPRTSWLPTEAEKVDALTAAGIARDVLPRRLYQGAVGAQYRYFPHKLPVALDGWRATFVFVQAEDESASAVRTWGSQHAALWAGLIAAGRAVEVICRRPGSGTSGGGGAGARQVGLDASGVRDNGARGRGGGDGRGQEGDRDGRLGRPGDVRRPESRVAAHAHPQRRLRRKPPIHGRHHDGPDVAVDAGAV